MVSNGETSIGDSIGLLAWGGVTIASLLEGHVNLFPVAATVTLYEINKNYYPFVEDEEQYGLADSKYS